jgi:hypothetical protein
LYSFLAFLGQKKGGTFLGYTPKQSSAPMADPKKVAPPQWRTQKSFRLHGGSKENRGSTKFPTRRTKNLEML